jgi:hypothetical protein
MTRLLRVNPAVCVVIAMIYCGPVSGYTPKQAAFARSNILDKILATGGYFTRLQSCGIKNKSHDMRPDIRQQIYWFGANLFTHHDQPHILALQTSGGYECLTHSVLQNGYGAL